MEDVFLKQLDLGKRSYPKPELTSVWGESRALPWIKVAKKNLPSYIISLGPIFSKVQDLPKKNLFHPLGFATLRCLEKVNQKYSPKMVGLAGDESYGKSVKNQPY